MRTRRGERAERLDALRRVGLFAGCSDRELERIGSLLSELDRPEGDILVREGVTGRQCMILLEGTAEVSRDGRPLGVLGPGSVIGELSLLYDMPRTATVTATSPLRLFVLTPGEFSGLLEESPGVRAAVMHAAEERMRAVQGARDFKDNDRKTSG